MIVGSFLEGVELSRYIGGALSEQLQATGWLTTVTSRSRSPWRRVCEMVTDLWKKRGEYSVAIVEVYSGRAFLWAEVTTRLLRSLNKPYILALHGGELPQFARNHPKRVARLLQRTPMVVSPSAYLIHELGQFRRDIRKISNPISIRHLPYRHRPSPKPNLIWLRAFHHIYNPILFPAVVSQLRVRYPDIKGTMLGPDKGDGSLQETQALIRKLGLDAHIQFIPGVKHAEVGTWLDSSDLFVNTTNSDNTPVSVLEAMACGLPVVTTNVGGLPYLLEHETNALLTPPNDATALAECIHRLCTEPGLALRLAGEARKLTAEFCWEKILPKWEALLTEAMEGADRPSKVQLARG